MLEILRRWWQLARPREWLFVGEAGSDRPLAAQNPQRWYRACAPQKRRLRSTGISVSTRTGERPEPLSPGMGDYALAGSGASEYS